LWSLKYYSLRRLHWTTPCFVQSLLQQSFNLLLCPCAVFFLLFPHIHYISYSNCPTFLQYGGLGAAVQIVTCLRPACHGGISLPHAPVPGAPLTRPHVSLISPAEPKFRQKSTDLYAVNVTTLTVRKERLCQPACW